MSTLSLPSYAAPALQRTPTYSAEPQDHEQRIALADRLRPRPSGNFVKQSKGGGVRLCLNAQDDKAELPVYAQNGNVEGNVELSKTEGVTSVEVKIEGRLLLKEIAEGGTSTATLCLNTSLLWSRDSANPICPPTLHFSLGLPSTFTYENQTYPLPPTFYVKLSGLPGFVATIDYSVTALVAKPNSTHIPKVKSKALGIHVGTTVVSTPFVYSPRTRPASTLPLPLQHLQFGFHVTPDWKLTESIVQSKSAIRPNLKMKLYMPNSRTFCKTQTIPFHLTVQSSPISIAAFLPFSPTANTTSTKKITRIQLMRQTTVDVRNTVVAGVKTDMWRVDCIGEGKFKHAGDGPNWISFSGDIVIDEDVKVTGFKAAGLSVKDFILFTINPPDPHKSPFHELREVIPVRLTTDPWTPNGTGIGATRDAMLLESVTPPSPPDDARIRYSQEHERENGFNPYNNL